MPIRSPAPCSARWTRPGAGASSQLAFNREHGITPRGVKKAVADIMEGAHAGAPGTPRHYARVAEPVLEYAGESTEKLTQRIRKLEQEMYRHARNLEFEEAARLRDEVHRIKQYGLGLPDQEGAPGAPGGGRRRRRAHSAG